MQDLTHACARASAAPTQTHWLDDASLLRENVTPWAELPLWIPEMDADAGGLMLARADRAVAAGLTFRGIDNTVRDTLVWASTLAKDDPARGVGKTLTSSRENELLQKFGLIK
jgi:2'-hydroxyisoflavone reductase